MRRRAAICAGIVVAALLEACSGSQSAASRPAAAAASAQAQSQLILATGFRAEAIANVHGARELAALPNGDLLVGTSGTTLVIVSHADDAGAPGTPRVFATLTEGPLEGVAFGAGAVYAASTSTIWRMPYVSGDTSEATAKAIARVRTGPVAPNSDGDVHVSTSVAATASNVYVGVGSSCNACIEVDATRAAVERMNPDGSGMLRLATRTRNPIALAINPATNSLWIGGAGQDGLTYGHPYEYLDSPTLRGTHDVDYGWPACEENHVQYNSLHASPAPGCSGTVAPAIVFPAYATLVGAAFYPANQTGAHAFPAAYRGGVFVTAHGSWHCCPATPPRVFFVAMSGDAPRANVDWSDPTKQSTEFVRGFGTDADSRYAGRPTGVAVGVNGSLFVADDATGNIYRIRPS